MNPYFTVLKQLLPSGRIWNVDPGSKFEGLIHACSQEFYRIAQRIERIKLELDPDQIDESLTDWERVFEIKPKGDLAKRKRLISWILKNDYNSSAASIMKAARDLGIVITVLNFDTAGRVVTKDFEKKVVFNCFKKAKEPEAEMREIIESLAKQLLPMHTNYDLEFTDV